MTTYKTGNPLGSAAAKDLFDNAQNLDFAVNDELNTNWIDRFGRGRKTLYGIEKEAEQVILSLGYITIDSFEDGAQITLRNQVLRWGNSGEYYRWDGDLPKNVAAGSTPDNSGGIGAGAWVAMGDAILRSQLSDPDGVSKYPEIQMSRWRDEGDARGWGVKGDGVTDDTAALTLAVNSGASVISIPAGIYLVTSTLDIPAGVLLCGRGTDYWDTHRPSPERLQKSWEKGTHLLFTGTGVKDQGIANLTNTKTAKIDASGNVFGFTSFTQEDSSGGSTATPKPFSCALKLTHGSGLKDLRVMINYNGIDGYNDSSLTGLGDEWDVGVWTYDSYGAQVDNVQIVGYWRMAALLLTENDGQYSWRGNPEQTLFHNVYTQGMRGCLIRNSPQIEVTARNSNNSLTARYYPSWTLTSSMSFTLVGSITEYSFTSYSVDSAANTITLSGITPDLPSSVTALRSPVQGNNWSGTVFDACKFNSLDHTSGQSSLALGLGQAAALEADGYPCRNLRFLGTKMQTVYDKLNTILGNCNDWKFVAGAFENGAMVAYGYDEAPVSYTGNVRMDAATEISTSSTDMSLFTPRDAFISYLQMATQYTDGEFSLKNWRAKNLEVQYADGDYGILLRDSDGNWQAQNGNGLMFMRSQGASNGLDLYGAQIGFSNVAGASILQLYTSTNALLAGIMTATGGFITTGNVRPSSANVGSLGTATYPFANGYTQTAMQVTSDRRQKTDETELDETEKKVGVRLKALLKKYKLKASVDEKGDDARWHTGIIAQDVIDAFTAEGLDATDYGMLCHDEWEASEEVKEEDGTISQPAVEAGDRYTVRYEELIGFILAAI